MKIKSFDIVMSVDEVRAIFKKNLDGKTDIQDPDIYFEEGSLVLTGKYPSPIPLMKEIPLKLKVTPNIDESQKVAFNVNLLNMDDMISGFVMKFLKGKLEQLNIKCEGNKFIPDIPAILKSNKIDGDVIIKNIDISKDEFRISLAGEGSLIRLFEDK